MTLEQIKYVLEVESTGSINRAAAKLFVTQSALSMAIKNFEDELGYQIFLRTNRGVVPTPSGKSLIAYLHALNIQLDNINKVSYQGDHPGVRTFVIATDGFTCCSMICGFLLKKYGSKNLQVEIYSSYGDQSRILVSERFAEVGLTRVWSCNQQIELRQMRTLGIAFHPLYKGELAIRVGPGNPLFHQKDLEYVTPEMLAEYPRVKYDCEERGPLASLTRLGIKENCAPILTSSRAVINDMLAYSDAYYIETDLPKNMVCKRAMPERRVIPLKGSSVTSTIGWIALKDYRLGDIASEFIDMVERWFNGELQEEDIIKTDNYH